MQKLIIKYMNGSRVEELVHYATFGSSEDDGNMVLQYSPVRKVYGTTSVFNIIKLDPEYIESVEVHINGYAESD